MDFYKIQTYQQYFIKYKIYEKVWGKIDWSKIYYGYCDDFTTLDNPTKIQVHDSVLVCIFNSFIKAAKN